MKRNINIVVGILCLVNIVYKLGTCINCSERFFGMEVSGPIYFLIWTFLMVVIFYGVYRDRRKA